jgi:5-methylcytosine-specific restriction protein A
MRIAVPYKSPTHRQLENAKRTTPPKPSPNKRGYGSRWKRLRLMMLRRFPICRRCPQASSEVDHIVPLSKGGTDAMDNLQTLCHKCHSRKTVVEDGGFGH